MDFSNYTLKELYSRREHISMADRLTAEDRDMLDQIEAEIGRRTCKADEPLPERKTYARNERLNNSLNWIRENLGKENQNDSAE